MMKMSKNVTFKNDTQFLDREVYEIIVNHNGVEIPTKWYLDKHVMDQMTICDDLKVYRHISRLNTSMIKRGKDNLIPNDAGYVRIDANWMIAYADAKGTLYVLKTDREHWTTKLNKFLEKIKNILSF